MEGGSCGGIGCGVARDGGRVLGWMGCRRVLWRDRVWGGKGWREGLVAG